MAKHAGIRTFLRDLRIEWELWELGSAVIRGLFFTFLCLVEKVKKVESACARPLIFFQKPPFSPPPPPLF
jgi:hypothetical protein